MALPSVAGKTLRGIRFAGIQPSAVIRSLAVASFGLRP